MIQLVMVSGSTLRKSTCCQQLRRAHALAIVASSAAYAPQLQRGGEARHGSHPACEDARTAAATRRGSARWRSHCGWRRAQRPRARSSWTVYEPTWELWYETSLVLRHSTNAQTCVVSSFEFPTPVLQVSVHMSWRRTWSRAAAAWNTRAPARRAPSICSLGSGRLGQDTTAISPHKTSAHCRDELPRRLFPGDEEEAPAAVGNLGLCSVRS